MSFSSLKGFYVSNDLDVLLDKLAGKDEDICRIEACILLRALRSGSSSTENQVTMSQRTYVHVILTMAGIVVSRMYASKAKENADSVVIPWNQVRHIERKAFLATRTEAFRLFGCQPKGREQLYEVTFFISRQEEEEAKVDDDDEDGRGSRLGRRLRQACFPSRPAAAAGDRESWERIELLTIEPDSHLFATSSLIWIEKKIEDGRKTLAPLSPKKKVKTAQATHEENARFYHNFVTLLDSKRIVDAGDAVALKELVSTMHESSASNALHFKQVLYSSSKAWPAIVERLSSWLEFYLGSEGPVRHDEVGAAARGRAGPQPGTLEAQLARFSGKSGPGPVYSAKFRRLKEWPFAFTSKDPLPYHAKRQKKWFEFVQKAARDHVLYKIRYLIHLVYYLVKESCPIQERLYWLLEPSEEEREAGGHSCFLDLFVLMCRCLRVDEISGVLKSEMENEVVSILYYVLNFSVEAAESEDRDPLSFLSLCLESMPTADVEYLVGRLLKPDQMRLGNLTYELYQSLHLASRIIKLRPRLVRSLGDQFSTDWRYQHHKIEGDLDAVAQESFLNKIYTSEYTKIYGQLSGMAGGP